MGQDRGRVRLRAVGPSSSVASVSPTAEVDIDVLSDEQRAFPPLAGVRRAGADLRRRRCTTQAERRSRGVLARDAPPRCSSGRRRPPSRSSGIRPTARGSPTAAERLGQLPRPPRRGRQGRQGRLPLRVRARWTRTTARSPSRELKDEVCRFAGALRELGIGKGDVVGIYMGMVPELPGRDAGLRPAGRAARGGVRRLLGRGAGRAARVDRGQGAGHPGRGLAQGRPGRAQGDRRRGA